MIVWIMAALGVLLYAAAVLRMTVLRDEGVYVLFGACMADGAIFFRDYIDRKLPFLMETIAAVFRVLPPSIAAARVVPFTFAMASLVAMWRVSHRLFEDDRWRVAAIAAFLWHLPLYGGAWTVTEQPVGCLGAFAVLLVLLDDRRSRTALYAAAGLLVGIAVGYKQVGVFYACAIGMWHLVDSVHRHTPISRYLREAGAFAGAVLLPMLLVHGWYAATGDLAAVVNSVWIASTTLYEPLPLARWPYEVLRGQIARGFSLWGPAVVVGAISLWRFIRRGEDRTVALIALSVAISFYPSTKRTYQHYVLAYLPMLTLLGMVGWRRAFEYAASRGRSRVIVAALCVVSALGAVRHYVVYTGAELVGDGLGTQMAISERISSELGPHEPLYVLGGQPTYYVMSGRYRHRPPALIIPDTRYLVPAELLYDRLTNPEVRHVVLAGEEFGDLRDVAEAVGEHGALLWSARAINREVVRFYRLPGEWQAIIQRLRPERFRRPASP